jgi:hypothetical protein
MSYPREERQRTGYAIRYIKALMSSDAIREHGSDAVMLCIFIASREDRLHYSKAPSFWRAELMERIGKKSPKDFLRVRNVAIDAGLLFHKPGTKKTPGFYWTLVPKWLMPSFEAFLKGNGIKRKRSQNGTESGTESGTEKGTHSITRYPLPVTGRNGHFVPPTVEEVSQYCKERKNSVDPERFVDYYTTNGWLQSKGKPIRDWKAAVRTWERNEFSKKTRTEKELDLL